MLGPALEAALKPHGLTLRHFPQSFEFSTLGGWIATRSGGHFATLYTHIDDFVESLRVVTPAGVIESRRLPGSGAGPSPDRLLIGSEGALGVITEAWMRLQDRPTFRAGAAVAFATFVAGARAVRAVAQAGLYPSNLRLLDADGAPSTAPATAATRSWCWASNPPTIRSSLAGARRSSSAAITAAGARARSRGAGARPWRTAFIRMPYARELLVPRGDRRHLRDRDHLGPLRGVPRPHQGRDRAGDPRGDRQAGRGHLPLHPRLSGRPGALLHVPCHWAAPTR